MKTSFALWGAIAAQALAAPSGHHYTLHERRDVLPASWSEGARLDRSVKLPMRIGLSQSNLDHGHDILMDVSHPKSAKYGQFFSPEAIHDLFAPAQKSVDSVRDWLESMGIAGHRVSQSANKQWLQFDAHPDEVENLLQTEYYTYEHEDTGRSHVACQEYHVPKHIQEHIDFVKPGIHGLELRDSPETAAMKKRTFRSRQGTLPPIVQELTLPLQALLGNLLGLCGVAITPPCINALYNIPKGDKASEGNELGVYEGLGDVYSQTDLDLFFTSVYSEIPSGTHPELKAIDGAKAPVNSSLKAGPESNLDFQISYPLIWPQNSILFQTDDPVYQENYEFPGFLNTFLDGIDGSYCDKDQTGDGDLDPTYPHNVDGGYKGQLQCGVYKPTNVISISYGGAEADLPISYQRRQCNEFMKLGLQGVSVVVASGDSGVAGRGGDPRPSNCLGENDKVYAPDFPATCPYLTTTGGTYLPIGSDASAGQEQAVTKFPSGGGFSNIYKRADYQKQAVEDYFAKHDPKHPYYESVNNNSFAANGGIYNRIGRAYPDVAALADNILVFSSGLPSLVSGTSAAAPVFAALLTRINEERIAKGKGTVGFVNPVLYQHPEVFNDITEGSNSGCGGTAFEAVEGWDPVTGLGTPNYPKLLDVFMNQP